MEIRQTYNIPKIVGMFEKSWGQKFDPSSHESCACLFEECVFGHHINPQHAGAIVEEAKKLVCTEVKEADGSLVYRSYDYPAYMKGVVVGEENIKASLRLYKR